MGKRKPALKRDEGRRDEGREPAPLTHAKLAQMLGVAKRTLEDYFSRGCPRGPFAAIEAWRAQNISPAKRRGGDDGEFDQAKADLEKQKLVQQIRLAKLKADIAEGRVIEKELVERAFLQLQTLVKNRLERLPEKIAIHVPRETRLAVQREAENEIFLTLKELSEQEI